MRELFRKAIHPLVSGISVAVAETDNYRDLVRNSWQQFDRWLFEHEDYVRIIFPHTLRDISVQLCLSP